MSTPKIIGHNFQEIRIYRTDLLTCIIQSTAPTTNLDILLPLLSVPKSLIVPLLSTQSCTPTPHLATHNAAVLICETAVAVPHDLEAIIHVALARFHPQRS
jgi:hypothetical protein